MVPLCDVQAQYHELKDKIDAAVMRAMSEGRYILGPNVKAFEGEMAAYLGCGHAVGVNSGTDALHLALRALGIGPGDEVITTPFTFIATTEAIGLVGATPVFADIDPGTYNLDPARVEAAVTPRTKAILPVHLYGQPCDMDAIMEIATRRSLLVVEDCAQALGATYRGRRVGTFGDAACLSFFPSKNLGGFGDGGMVVTNSRQVYERAEMLRRHGGKVKYHHSELGLNSRLDEIQAAVLRVKLPHLDRWNHRRQACGDAYDRVLSQVEWAAPPARLPEATHVFHQYTIATDERDRLAAGLSARQIGNAVYYPIPLHLQRVHAGLNHNVGDFPEAERAARRCLSLPMFPQLTGEQRNDVESAIRGFSAIACAA